MKLIGCLSPAPREAWEEVFRGDPYALETQSPAWTEAMCAWARFEDASRLYETDEGRILVLPMLRRRLLGEVGLTEASNPHHCGVGGVLALGGPSPEEIGAVLRDLSERWVAAQSFYPNPLLAQAWGKDVPQRAIAIPRLAHALDLEGGFARVWSSRFSSSTRTAMRKAERAAVSVECDASGKLIPEFYELMEQGVTRWAKNQHEPRWLARLRFLRRDPPEKFEAISRTLAERCRVWLARVEGQPAAAFLVLQGTNAYGIRAAMDERLKGYGANDLLVRHIVEEACAAGCRYYYMGETGPLASRRIFKERLGATPLPYAQYRLERLPVTATERVLKGTVKRMIRFRD